MGTIFRVSLKIQFQVGYSNKSTNFTTLIKPNCIYYQD